MVFDPKAFEEFDVSTEERKMLRTLGGAKAFDLLCTVYLRWLVWRAHQLTSNPVNDISNDAEVLALQGMNEGFKKLLALVNQDDK